MVGLPGNWQKTPSPEQYQRFVITGFPTGRPSRDIPCPLVGGRRSCANGRFNFERCAGWFVQFGLNRNGYRLSHGGQLCVTPCERRRGASRIRCVPDATNEILRRAREDRAFALHKSQFRVARCLYEFELPELSAHIDRAKRVRRPRNDRINRGREAVKKRLRCTEGRAARRWQAVLSEQFSEVRWIRTGGVRI